MNQAVNGWLYTPPPGGGSPDWGYAAAPPPPPPKSKARGWIIAAVIALTIGCILTCALGFSCQSCFSMGKRERVRQIVVALRSAAQDHPNQATHEEDLRALEALNQDDGVAFMAFGTLENRFNDVSRDGNLTHEDVDHVMVLIDDIVTHDGNIDLARYPQGR